MERAARLAGIQVFVDKSNLGKLLQALKQFDLEKPAA